MIAEVGAAFSSLGHGDHKEIARQLDEFMALGERIQAQLEQMHQAAPPTPEGEIIIRLHSKTVIAVVDCIGGILTAHFMAAAELVEMDRKKTQRTIQTIRQPAPVAAFPARVNRKGS